MIDLKYAKYLVPQDQHFCVHNSIWSLQTVTIFFLLLFLGFLAIYELLRGQHRARLLYVTAFSLFFYYKSSGLYFLLLVFSTIVEYHFALWIADSGSPARRKLLMALSLLVNLGMLFYFKYTDFFLSGFHALTGQPVPGAPGGASPMRTSGCCATTDQTKPQYASSTFCGEPVCS